jgi:hypothetical protein
MSETVETHREQASEFHDHAWRRVNPQVEVGIFEYACDLCGVTWSGLLVARPRDPRRAGLRRG